MTLRGTNDNGHTVYFDLLYTNPTEPIMKIVSIHAREVLPVRRFDVDELSDVVVIAGPNGVGKTRLLSQLLRFLQSPTPNANIVLTLERTCEEEHSDWGQTTLRTSSDEDARVFAQTLQKNRRRRNWKSSILNFESDRSIQKMKPYAFSWDIRDPYEEEIGWKTTFGRMCDRFQDTVHAMFRLIEFQKRSIAGRAIQLRRAGKSSMQLTFSDPMEPFRNVFRQLLAPKELVDPNPKDQVLKYRIGEEEFPFSSLSSGEREVVNM